MLPSFSKTGPLWKKSPELILMPEEFPTILTHVNKYMKNRAVATLGTWDQTFGTWG